MIKQIFLSAYLCFLLCTGYCQTATECQSDLGYLQQTVHSKYSNLFYNISAPDWDKAVDELITQIPKHGNGVDSCAESFMLISKKEDAIKYF